MRNRRSCLIPSNAKCVRCRAILVDLSAVRKVGSEYWWRDMNIFIGANSLFLQPGRIDSHWSLFNSCPFDGKFEWLIFVDLCSPFRQGVTKFSNREFKNSSISFFFYCIRDQVNINLWCAWQFHNLQSRLIISSL